MSTPWYSVGTVTVTAGSTAVTGSGTGWTGAVRPGDRLWVNGINCRIASVNSATSLTLARPWPGASASGAYYEVLLTPDEAVIQAQLRELLDQLSNGNLEALAGLNTAADRMPYFSGSGAAALATLTTAGRAMLALSGSSGAKIPVVTGAGSAALRDIVGTVGHSDGTPTGALVQAGSNANGRYWRFAGGLQVCLLPTAEFVYGSTATLTCEWAYPASFADTPVCHASLHNAGASSIDAPYDTIGIHRYGSSPNGTGHILQKIYGAPNFVPTSRLLSVRLSAIGPWHE